MLALLVIVLASISTAQKVNAQEVKPSSSSAQTACPMAQFIVLGSTECKTHSKVNLSVTPVIKFMPEAPKVSKSQEKPVSASVSPIQASFNPTATLSADVLFDLTNSHRKDIGLSPFLHDKEVCSVAQSRKDEMVQEIFVTHQLHAGFYAKILSYFATENLIWNNSEAGALNWWLHSPIHKAAIDGNYKYACGVCNGDVCDMIFTNYDKKIVAVASTQNTPSPKNLVQ